jgi:outer membrane immunogenic protein
MKKIFLGSAAIAAVLGSQALAADLPARAPIIKAPPPIAVFSWSGCYIGGFVGGAFANENVRATELATGTGVLYNAPGAPYNYSLDANVIGGGTLGCNWQMPGSQFVLGIEGEGGFLSLKGSAVDPNGGFGDTIDRTRIGDWYAVVAGRLGWAADRVLFYVKGGAVFTDVKSTIVDTCTLAPCGPNAISASGGGGTRANWTAGGGIEYALTNNWTIKGEYLWLAIDQTTAVCGVAAVGGATFCSAHTFDGIHTGKVGLNYKF